MITVYDLISPFNFKQGFKNMDTKEKIIGNNEMLFLHNANKIIPHPKGRGFRRTR